MSTGRAREGAPLLGTCAADHPCAELPGHLYRGKAGAPGRAVDQNSLARAEPGGMHQPVMCAKQRNEGPGEVGARALGQQLDDAVGGIDRGVAAEDVRDGHQHVVAGPEPSAGTRTRDDPDAFHTRGGPPMGTPEVLGCQQSDKLHRVLVIEADGIHPHLDLSAPGSGSRNRPQHHIVKQP